MSEVRPEDTGVTTIPKNILNLVSSREKVRYKPSYIARLVNRSLPNDVYKDQNVSSLRKGHYVKGKENYHTFPANVTIEAEDGAKINYKDLTMPSYKSEEILNALDAKYEETDFGRLTEDQIYNFAAFSAIVTASAHPFPDGSGRAAIGVADILIRKYTGKSLNMTEIEKHDEELNMHMVPGTFSMMPGEFHPDIALGNARKTVDKTLSLEIPTSNKNGEVDKWVNEFSANIIVSVQNFSPKYVEYREDKESLNMYVDRLAKPYKAYSIPEQPQ